MMVAMTMVGDDDDGDARHVHRQHWLRLCDGEAEVVGTGATMTMLMCCARCRAHARAALRPVPISCPIAAIILLLMWIVVVVVGGDTRVNGAGWIVMSMRWAVVVVSMLPGKWVD